MNPQKSDKNKSSGNAFLRISCHRAENMRKTLRCTVSMFFRDIDNLLYTHPICPWQKCVIGGFLLHVFLSLFPRLRCTRNFPILTWFFFKGQNIILKNLEGTKGINVGSFSSAKTDKSAVFDHALGEKGTPIIHKSSLTMACSMVDVYSTPNFESLICIIVQHVQQGTKGGNAPASVRSPISVS